MSKVEGKSHPNIQHSDTSIQTTDQRMQQILSGPGTEKEKVAKLENELKTLMEAKPKTENDKKDLEAEKRQIQNQLKDPNSAFGKLSPASRHKLEEYFSRDGGIDSSRKQADSKSLKDGAVDRQRNRGVEERKLQESFMKKFTPQYYEEKINLLKKRIELGEEQLRQPPTFMLVDSKRIEVEKYLSENKQELEKLQAEYQHKFGLRPKPNMLQE